jgi:hypothetical protein
LKPCNETTHRSYVDFECASYSPSGRWVIYRWTRSPAGRAHSFVCDEYIYRVVPIGYIDHDALQHQIAKVSEQRRQQRHQRDTETKVNQEATTAQLTIPPPLPPLSLPQPHSLIHSLTSKHSLPYVEYHDEISAMGDIFAVPSATTTTPSPTSSTAAAESISIQQGDDRYRRIWREYIGVVEVEMKRKGWEPSWHPLEPCTLIIHQYDDNIREKKKGRDKRPNPKHVMPAPTKQKIVLQYRLPQRDLDKPIWTATIDNSTSNIITTPLLDIIFEYFDG